MVDVTRSACVNHPGIEATVRCKQCSRPVCDTCIVTGPTGRFCCPECKQKHEVFTQRAQQMDGKARTTLFPKLRQLGGNLLLAAAVVAALAVVGTIFDIPVLTPLVQQARGMIGL